MATLTPMTLAQAQRIGALFGMTVVGLTPIIAGSVNSNFVAELNTGARVFMRVCEESDAAAVHLFARLLDQLVAGGVPTPAPLLRTDGGGPVAHHAGKPVAVFPFIAGQSCCQRRCTPARLRQVGAALGRIHQAGLGFEEPPRNRFGLSQLRQRLHHITAASAATAPLPAALQHDIAQLSQYLDRLSRRATTTAAIIIHGDMFRDNVLWRGDNLVAILDFDSASLGHPAFDLMTAMLAWCYGDHLQRDLARALIAGYRSQAPISAEMCAHCYDEACAAAVRFAITRITDFELRPRGVVAYKDYRRFMARLAALEAIGSKHLVHWLGLS